MLDTAVGLARCHCELAQVIGGLEGGFLMPSAAVSRGGSDKHESSTHIDIEEPISDIVGRVLRHAVSGGALRWLQISSTFRTSCDKRTHSLARELHVRTLRKLGPLQRDSLLLGQSGLSTSGPRKGPSADRATGLGDANNMRPLHIHWQKVVKVCREQQLEVRDEIGLMCSCSCSCLEDYCSFVVVIFYI